MERATQEDMLLEFRRMVIEQIRQKYGEDFAEFSPEQWEEQEQSIGSVFVPQFKEHVKFTNLKPRHFKRFYRSFYSQEVAQAVKQKRDVDKEKIKGFGEYLLANINGWGAHMYWRTSQPLGPLAPSPVHRPSFWERRRLKKQGGW